MAILSIVKMYKENYECKGSCLRTPSNDITEVEFGSEWLKIFIHDMLETLYSNSSGVGLAANQVGVLKKICVVDIKKDGKKPIALINPNYEPLNEETIDSHEVCLSFPNISSLIKRHKKIKVKYQDFYGQKHEFIAEGFKSTVFQHEIDHLNGIVHIDLKQIQDEVTDYIGYSAKLAQNAIDKILNTEGSKGDERQ